MAKKGLTEGGDRGVNTSSTRPEPTIKKSIRQKSDQTHGVDSVIKLTQLTS